MQTNVYSAHSCDENHCSHLTCVRILLQKGANFAPPAAKGVLFRTQYSSCNFCEFGMPPGNLEKCCTLKSACAFISSLRIAVRRPSSAQKKKKQEGKTLSCARAPRLRDFKRPNEVMNFSKTRPAGANLASLHSAPNVFLQLFNCWRPLSKCKLTDLEKGKAQFFFQRLTRVKASRLKKLWNKIPPLAWEFN